MSFKELFGIPSVLIPYTEFSAQDLAEQLHRLTAANYGTLRQRNLGGVIVRYGGTVEAAVANVRKGQREQTSLGHYAVVPDSGDVVGAASIMPSLPLRRLRFGVAPGYTRADVVEKNLAERVPGIRKVARLVGSTAAALTAVEYPYAGPNIHAWASHRATTDGILADAYRDLAFTSGGGLHRHPRQAKPWAVEPRRAHPDIHASIRSAGLEEVTTGYFDEGEDLRTAPPEGVLYANLYSSWRSERGRLRELRTGDISLLTRFDDFTDEQISRHPRG